MATRLLTLLAVGLVVAACGSTTSTVAPSVSGPPPAASTAGPATWPSELRKGSGALAPGTYTRGGFRPPVTFAVATDDWTVGSLSDGFFDIQQRPGTPTVVAVQFARVLGVPDGTGAMTPAGTAAEAADAIAARSGATVASDSPSRLGGLEGRVVEIENAGPTHLPVMEVSLGTLGFDPDRRLWISLFDTPDGVVSVMVGGPSEGWEDALHLAEPVLESVTFAAS